MTYDAQISLQALCSTFDVSTVVVLYRWRVQRETPCVDRLHAHELDVQVR